MTHVIVNQCCAEPSQAHAVPTGHPALKRYACLPSVVILDTRWHHTITHWFISIDRLSKKKKTLEEQEKIVSGENQMVVKVFLKKYLNLVKIRQISANITEAYHRDISMHLGWQLTKKLQCMMYRMMYSYPFFNFLNIYIFGLKVTSGWDLINTIKIYTIIKQDWSMGSNISMVGCRLLGEGFMSCNTR